jgi:hypothetical protein
MGNTLLIIHSLLRWVVILTGFWAVIKSFSGLTQKRVYTAADGKSNLFFMISCDLQLVIGLLLYFVNGWAANWTNGNLHAVMNNQAERFFTVEHESMMIIAWLLVHIGRVVVKKGKTDRTKFSKSLIYFGVALLLILLAIPWPFRGGGVGRPWLW